MKAAAIAGLALAASSVAALPGAARAGEAPSAFSCSVHVVYLNPAGREPVEGYRERLDRIMTDIQSFYRDEMARNGYGAMTFPLERDGEGRVVVHVANAEKTWSVQQGPGFGEVRNTYVRPLLQKRGIDVDRNHVVVFQNLIWTSGGNKLTPKAPYCGAGDHLQGTAMVTDHAILDTRNFEVSDRFVVDRGSRQSWGRYNVIQIGGVAHEMGHSFGLPHNRETPAQKETLGTALMGGGNYTYRNERATSGKKKGSFITAAHALALSVHPLFRRDDAGRERPAAGELRELSFRQEGEEMIVDGAASGPSPVIGIVAYNDALPTGTNKDYDAFSWAARIGADGRFRLTIDQLEVKEYQLSLRAYEPSGAWKTFRFQYKVAGRPVVPVETLNRNFHAIQARSAFDARDRDRMDAALAALSGTKDDALRTARALDRRLREWEALDELASVPGDRAEQPLSGVRWASAKVGWHEPSYDGVVVDGFGRREKLESKRRVHTRGIYAHAPSRYVYLVDGKWGLLRGAFGLQKGHPGSVVFKVIGDGRELFRSDVVRDYEEYPLRVDVTDVDRLELVVSTTPDGASSDWGIWFDPRLER
ncbi:MAG: NPCBM/NEW2 domain-containing protein [Planctomycetota bacterium]|jgi:hypothetical protein